mmetsp:Transcript_20927/g.72189  ORF Transcript_20927/g.72189 Transcript_20927/m.72189 type:complete len:296 (-) Transcript_20927:195-1082(-)|eukprot:CAMPEP_0204159682 /NCGR_PEP_ID=MMETSP0361-20130328/33212_1 /ASSEMBLY_ACC=CAM_ASM_000343 /TAXON_ID=268821 /ORGANISM="Scrippsiella Hangoei, Strain SHTV-5" /LENGTH=295 /DNA_ID=CAMNT_0051115843 /DNA_START=51 /DNA_END=938 /DNA_ORIENTATION=+
MAGTSRDTSFARPAIAGAAAACAATVVFHPIDTLKTVLQRGGQGNAATVVRSLGGIGSLYVGVMPAAVSMGAACAVRMAVYEVTKNRLVRDGGGAPSGEPLLPLPTSALIAVSSGLSVVVSAMVRAPLDMVKTQMQAAGGSGASGRSSSSAAVLRSAFAERGVPGLYRGAGLALARDVPFFSLNLVLYERLRLARRRQRASSRGATCSREELPVYEAILIGGVSQGFAGFATNPIDVLKTRVQAGVAGSASDAFRNVLRDGGLRALMRGALTRTAWVALQGCVYYPVYELALSTL